MHLIIPSFQRVYFAQQVSHNICSDPETVPVAKDIQSWWPRNLEGLLMYCDETMSTFMEAIIACGYVGLTESSSLLIRVVVIFSLFLIITLSFWFCHKKSSLR